MGHEASGIIEQLGEQVTDHFIGEPVTFDSTEFCGSCDFCKKGMTNLCKNRKITGVSCTDYKKDGAMAEYITCLLYTSQDNGAVVHKHSCDCQKYNSQY